MDSEPESQGQDPFPGAAEAELGSRGELAREAPAVLGAVLGLGRFGSDDAACELVYAPCTDSTLNIDASSYKYHRHCHWSAAISSGQLREQRAAL